MGPLFPIPLGYYFFRVEYRRSFLLRSIRMSMEPFESQDDEAKILNSGVSKVRDLQPTLSLLT